ncbi:Dihydrolipoyllysine-residue acetyltransferase component of pyruvate dehydrogenase complex [Roseobacter fucihabitans]|uniref:Dihydrolipoamide acetyltransferase component of pyruvate dehydrogenase complex n=1 Tax=Roseobacter fucihabitans TaxID=1537242 RepID=A0ABZ2BU81_9RHOB|nr:2-oxo acid dehydrogenase subunit E2 [Roseobacter litoralis]MBC6967353.1 Dihydrolipoyllysine-residue acetyltransferase component of pyruvate dehydrogenase complex [Roseobacter litoralis]
MTTQVTVPDIGDFADVPVVGILVAVGDMVALEDSLVEIESDKATMEVPSPAAGKIVEILISEGQNVSKGTPLLVIEEEGSGDTPAPVAATPAAAVPDIPVAQASVAPVTDAGFGKAHASPSIRAFARTLDIDITKVNGTGRKGRILREDVTKFLKATTAPAAGGGAQSGGMGIPPIPVVDFSKFGPIENVEMPRIKKLSGPALHRSWLNIPHVTHNEEADITDLDTYRRELDAQAKTEGYRVTLLSFVIKASVSALKQHWEVNSSVHPDGDKLIKKDFFNIGFAADTPNGLMVPVIKDADRKGLVQISKELGDLSAQARDGKLKSADMQGATCTISSLGGIGGTSFTPIVNAPEVAILGLTRSKIAPVWDGEAFQPRNMQPLSLSYDHRAIDGALAARFCATLKHLLGDVRRLML